MPNVRSTSIHVYPYASSRVVKNKIHSEVNISGITRDLLPNRVIWGLNLQSNSSASNKVSSTDGKFVLTDGKCRINGYTIKLSTDNGPILTNSISVSGLEYNNDGIIWVQLSLVLDTNEQLLPEDDNSENNTENYSVLAISIDLVSTPSTNLYDNSILLGYLHKIDNTMVEFISYSKGRSILNAMNVWVDDEETAPVGNSFYAPKGSDGYVNYIPGKATTLDEYLQEFVISDGQFGS